MEEVFTGTRYVEGWANHIVGLNVVEETDFSPSQEMNHDRPARTLSLLMADSSSERAIRLSVYQCGNVNIRISSAPLIMHSTAQVNWFCGENAMQGRRKKQKTKGGRKRIKK
jgi:hypothetical protein